MAGIWRLQGAAAALRAQIFNDFGQPIPMRDGLRFAMWIAPARIQPVDLICHSISS
jgi:hypothetical protein